MSTSTDAPTPAGASRSRTHVAPEVTNWLKEQYSLFILIGLLIIASFSTSAFLTEANLTNVIAQLSVVGIVVLAQLLVVISGGIDISVGSVLGLAAVLSAGLFDGSNVFVALLVALGVGTALGAVNGFLIAYRGINAFIVTLGMLSLARGLVLAYTKGAPVSPTDPDFLWPGTATIFGDLPVLGLFWLGAILAVAYLLYRTVLGRRIYAAGSNPAAAYSSGLPVRGTLMGVYVIAGMLVGLAGFLATSRVGAGTPTAGQSFELDAIAAVVIGGARLNGGYGRVFGAVVGTLIFGVITNVLQLLDVSTYYQSAAKGALILIAVLLATAGRRPPPGSS